ncbi:glycosyltransferase family 25 protein [Streptomyces sp. NPDC057620]|uniref:glycosyltransferase family 25 protein n=1 Tax=Streptomyces sp. NPDC057620 TaxID=3346185 RepID=UPI0036C1A7A0
MEAVLPPELDVIFTSDWGGPFDGRDLTLAGLEQHGYQLFPWRIPSDRAWWNRSLRFGEIGCALSHLACWRDAAARAEPYLMVLEDDVVLVPGFLEVLLDELNRLASHGPAFDLLYLGRCPRGVDRPVRPGLVSPGFSYATTGYLVGRAGLEVMLSARLDQAILPVDEFLPALYTDHPRPDVRARFPQRLTALAFDPPLLTDLPVDGEDSNTRDSAPAQLPASGGDDPL